MIVQLFLLSTAIYSFSSGQFTVQYPSPTCNPVDGPVLNLYYALPMINNFCDPHIIGTNYTQNLSVYVGSDVDYYGFTVSATWQGGHNCQNTFSNHDCVALLDSVVTDCSGTRGPRVGGGVLWRCVWWNVTPTANVDNYCNYRPGESGQCWLT